MTVLEKKQGKKILINRKYYWGENIGLCYVL